MVLYVPLIGSEPSECLTYLISLCRAKFFLNDWNKTLLECEKRLNSDDLKQVRRITSYNKLWRGIPQDTDPYERIWKLALQQFRRFTNVFETKLTIGLSVDFFWGALALLIKESSHKPLDSTLLTSCR